MYTHMCTYNTYTHIGYPPVIKLVYRNSNSHSKSNSNTDSNSR